jgi:hypothetical protein
LQYESERVSLDAPLKLAKPAWGGEGITPLWGTPAFHYDHALYSAPLNALVREVPYLHHLREEGGVGSLGVGGGVGEGSLNSLFGYDLAAQRPIHVRWLITGLAESTFLPSV